MLISFKEIEENVKPQKNYDAGVYEVQVVKAEEGCSNNGTPQLFVEFETRGVETFNVKHWFYKTPKALSILLNFLSAVGIYDKESKEDVNYSPEDLLGSILKVEFVKDNDNKYLVLKPWSCEAVGGLATPTPQETANANANANDSVVVGDEEIPF